MKDPVNPRDRAEALLVPPVRASQKVREFIFQEAKKHGEREWRLPAMRQLAKYLEVSVATVQSVYSTLAQEGYISSAANRGSFFHAPAAASHEPWQIGLAFLRDDEDFGKTWRGGIYAGIMEASFEAARTVNFAQIAATREGLAQARKQHAERPFDGMIILAGDRTRPIADFCESEGIPTAFLLPPDIRSMANFICPDVYEAAAGIAGAFLSTGRRKLAFVEVVKNDNKPYYILYREGFMRRILDREGQLGKFVHVAAQESDRGQLEKLLKSSHRPDALLCGTAPLAAEALAIARELGIRVPEDLSIVAGGRAGETDPLLASATHVWQSLPEIGHELMRLIERRIAEPGRLQPGKYLPCTAVPGATTTARENKLLRSLGERR